MKKYFCIVFLLLCVYTSFAQDDKISNLDFALMSPVELNIPDMVFPTTLAISSEESPTLSSNTGCPACETAIYYNCHVVSPVKTILQGDILSGTTQRGHIYIGSNAGTLDAFNPNYKVVINPATATQITMNAYVEIVWLPGFEAAITGEGAYVAEPTGCPN